MPLEPKVEHLKAEVKRELALGRPDATWGYLHDNAIFAFKGRLFVAWYNCPKGEMIGDSVIRGRWSDDAGRTWSPVKTFVGRKGGKFMYVPPAFGSDGKELFLFASRMTGPDVVQDCEIFKWNAKDETFASVGLMGGRFIPNTCAFRRSDGTFMIGGRRCVVGKTPGRPTLAVSETKDLAGKWRFVDLADEKIPGEGIPWICPEMALVADGRSLTAYVRVQDYKYPDGKGMRVFKSPDEGATWKMVDNPPFRVNPAKPAAGLLSDGRRYLIANAREKDNRRSLILWLTEKGSEEFTRAYYVQQGDNPRMGLKYEWCYPSTCEYKGELYIVTSTCTDVRVKNSSGLTIIPLSALGDPKSVFKSAPVRSAAAPELGEDAWKDVTFITAADARKGEEPDTTVCVRTYENAKAVREAWWYVTGGGVFRAFVNGMPITDDRLLPGYTTIEQRRHFFAYDVTKLMDAAAGAKNVFAAESVSTWWTRMEPWALAVKENCFGAILLVRYADGTEARFPTDCSWQAAFAGPVREATLFQGEVYDAREKTPWRTAGAPAAWKKARPFASLWAIGKVTPIVGPKVRFREDLKHGCAEHYAWRDAEVEGADTNCFGKVVRIKGNPLKIGPGEEIVFDFWQNHAAVPEVIWRAKRGVTATLRFSEMLNDANGERSRGNDGPAGSLYLKNLRSAKALVKYTFSGEGDETYVTENTFFGYRYMSVRADGPVEILSAQAIPVSSVSAEAEAGEIVTGREDLNKLISNIRWGMRSNYLSVPTDCPQRDERQGWSADTQVFAPAGCYLADVDGFLTKWMDDLVDSIEPATGSFPFVAPIPRSSDNHLGPSTGWSDAGIVVPHVLYRMYGDRSVLERNFAAMDRFMDVIARDPIPRKPCPDFGDWLAYEGNGEELRHLISQAYLVWDARLMIDVARALGKADAVKKYEALDRQASADFRAKYLGPDGLLVEKCRFQTGYAFAILLKLVEGAAYDRTVAALVRNIADHGGKLQTGFLGTAVLPYALTAAGRADVAYDILLQHGCPSWLYSVDQGATTVWERWNSYTKEKGFGDAGMNSFNHYAYGSVLAWLYEDAVGLRPDPARPGFRHFFLTPHPDKRVGFIGASYRSAAGLITSCWRYDGTGQIRYSFRVPEGTTATLTLPGERPVELQPGQYEMCRSAPTAEAKDVEVSVACVRGSHLYACSERAEFDVTASEPGASVKVAFARGYLPPLEQFVTTTPARVSFALGEPGFIVCEARAVLPKGRYGKVSAAGAGFEPHNIKTVQPPPADYDAFWKSAFAEQAAIEPDFTVRPLSNDVSLVSCKTVWGTRMYGFLHIPKGRGPCPLQVTVGGGDSVFYSGHAVKAGGLPEYADRGFLFLHLPAFEPMAETLEEVRDLKRKWLKENGIGGSLIDWNCDRGPRERWYYRCILGCCRLIEYAARQPGVDPARVYYHGSSTGGGYGVFLSAFSPHIRAAVCEVPNYGNAAGPSVGRPSGEDDRGKHWQTSVYYDSAYCAPRITCPVFMSCGYLDYCCVPETIYCIFNALRCRKVMFDKVENGHGDVPKGYVEVRKAWLESSFGM